MCVLRSQTFSFVSLFPVQQTMSGIGHHVNKFFVFFRGLATNTTLNVRNNNNVVLYILDTGSGYCSVAI